VVPYFDMGWGIYPDDFEEFNAVILGNRYPLFLGILHPMLTPCTESKPTRERQGWMG
jgi:hypothetical protein